MRRVTLVALLGAFLVAAPSALLAAEGDEPHAPTTSTTTSSTSSTSSTSTSITSTTTSSSTTSSTITTVEVPVEICGDCVDNDGNGLTDFEDPACCGRPVTMTLKKARLAPVGGRALLSLKATLSAVRFSGQIEDAFLQLGRDGEPNVLCARLPAENLFAKGTSLGFRDKRHAVASALGLEKLVLTAKKGGSLGLVASGRQVAASVPSAGAVRITLGLHAAAGHDLGNVCAGGVANFRAAAKGALRAP